jgi:hypothetical protein
VADDVSELSRPKIEDVAGASGLGDGDDDDLSIGEVSRVVRIADLMPRNGEPKAAARRTGAVPVVARGTGMVPRLEAGGGGGGAGAQPAGAANAPASTLAPPLAEHRRQHVLLWGGGAAALLLVAVGIAVVSSGQDDDSLPSAFGGSDGFEKLGYRVDDPRRVANGSGVSQPPLPQPANPVTPAKIPPRITKNPIPAGSGQGSGSGSAASPLGPDGLPLTDLSAAEVEAMSQRMSSGNQRCYMRAIRKDPTLDVKKISAVVHVDTAGTVDQVTVSSHAGDELGVCLAGAIRRWKFRPSTEGITTELTFVFQ